jgi:20S proteasome alpha/beta subunit
VTVTATTTNGTNVLYCPKGYDGFFLGAALSGTGIPASTVVAGLDPDGKRIYTGSAIGTFGDKNSTATGNITLTGTYTGYGSGVINNPFAQGAIT